jgi:hypothetical protein
MVLRYFQTDKILFSASTLAPGERSNRDPGHAGAHEIGYCEAGQLVLQFSDGDDREYVRIGAGDAILINEGVPHALFNPRAEQAPRDVVDRPEPRAPAVQRLNQGNTRYGRTRSHTGNGSKPSACRTPHWKPRYAERASTCSM